MLVKDKIEYKMRGGYERIFPLPCHEVENSQRMR